LALATLSPVDKKYKPSKLENFAKMMDIANSLGSMLGSVSRLDDGKPKTGLDYFSKPSIGAMETSPEIAGGKLLGMKGPSLLSPLERYKYAMMMNPGG
jgi:hypothetical protein